MKTSPLVFAAAVIGVAALTAALAPFGGGFDLSWHTSDGGGGTSVGGGFELAGTIGQHDAGPTMSGGGFELTGGFWAGGQGPVSTPATLTDFTVTFGTLISGTLQNLQTSDNTNLRIRSRFGFVSAEPNVLDVLIGAVTSVQSPTLLDLSVEGRISQAGGTSKLRLRNWSTNALQQVHQYPIGSTETVNAIENVSATNRVRQSDGRIDLSIRQSVMVVFTAAGFDSFTDHVVISVE